MISADDYRRIFAYNRQVLETYCRRLERLPWAIDSKDREVTWHSMAGVFDHVVGVYDGWMNYVVQGKRADESAPDRSWNSLTSMKEVRAYLEATWAGVDRLLSGLADASLRRKVKAPWQPKACPLGDALIQVTLEQAHHLGEIIAMLWQEDIEPPGMTWLATNWWLEAKAKKMRRGRKTGAANRKT